MKHRLRIARQAQTRQPARRRFIKTFLGTTAGLATPSLWASVHRQPERSLALKNLHTGESLKTTFWANGEFLKDELKAINHVLRDHRSGDEHPMDPKLLNLLYVLQQTVGVDGSYQVISGYRSPASNEKLRSQGNGVARKSLHMLGKAIDIRLPGCELRQLRDAAIELSAGGVGYYPGSNFIHVDTGRVRRW